MEWKKLPVVADIVVRNASIVSTVILGVSAVLAWRALRGIDYALIIHFTNAEGIDVVGTPAQIFGIIGAACIAFAFNIGIINACYDRARVLSYILSFFNVFFAILILISVGVIISVN
jgi:hypothetical protein